MDIIQSRQNPLVKQCIKLATHRRERLKAQQTLLDGPHLIAAALDTGVAIDRLIVAAGAVANPEICHLIERCQNVLTVVEDVLFAEFSDLESVTGIVGLIAIPPSPTAKNNGLILALDGVQDPGNVGSMLRTAAAAGVDQVWLSTGSADVWSPKVLRAGMGAHFLLPVIERAALVELLPTFKGKKAVTVLADSVSLYQADLRGDLLLIMGSEGQGVSSDVMALADLRLNIPMRTGLESLNVGAATAICLYERLRQQL